MAIGQAQGDLQTLIATLQNTNTQLGNVVKAIQGVLTTIETPTPVTGAPGTPSGTFGVTLPDGSTGYVPYYKTRPS